MAKAETVIELAHYDVVRAPIITEKSTMVSEHNQVAFKVANSATKPQIKAAIEALYGVKVTGVNTMIAKGKVKRAKGRPYKRADVKKAIITLAEGDMIDITSGVN
ncbi:50S ribosomal protein L23 [Pacificimonas sp. WHA3]|uniref:Large ribosomal subunit protein uL23 n=1 Tax=Pacificimonas pallii TaxID=2827236 RepID=A0ABS6SAY9_9SPHN|nr:50S ribosomal protein L23 [Pacificimonas pallii]MBV7255471.1 50S ribosomal protein L23 [Pacificimonas pallii]